MKMQDGIAMKSSTGRKRMSRTPTAAMTASPATPTLLSSACSGNAASWAFEWAKLCALGLCWVLCSYYALIMLGGYCCDDRADLGPAKGASTSFGASSQSPRQQGRAGQQVAAPDSGGNCQQVWPCCSVCSSVCEQRAAKMGEKDPVEVQKER